MSAICQNFVQNAWRKDLCSNCFKSKDDHGLHERHPSETTNEMGDPEYFSKRYLGFIGRTPYQRSFYGQKTWNSILDGKDSNSNNELKSSGIITRLPDIVSQENEKNAKLSELNSISGPLQSCRLVQQVNFTTHDEAWFISDLLKSEDSNEKKDSSSSDLGSDMSHDISSASSGSGENDSVGSEMDACDIVSDSSSGKSTFVADRNFDEERRQSILKSPSKTKSYKGPLRFNSKEEIIGFGGDVDYLDDENLSSSDDDDSIASSDLSYDELLLKRLTEKNTDFNSDNDNLTQEGSEGSANDLDELELSTNSNSKEKQSHRIKLKRCTPLVTVKPVVRASPGTAKHHFLSEGKDAPLKDIKPKFVSKDEEMVQCARESSEDDEASRSECTNRDKGKITSFDSEETLSSDKDRNEPSVPESDEATRSTTDTLTTLEDANNNSSIVESKKTELDYTVTSGETLLCYEPKRVVLPFSKPTKDSLLQELEKVHSSVVPLHTITCQRRSSFMESQLGTGTKYFGCFTKGQNNDSSIYNSEQRISKIASKCVQLTSDTSKASDTAKHDIEALYSVSKKAKTLGSSVPASPGLTDETIGNRKDSASQPSTKSTVVTSCNESSPVNIKDFSDGLANKPLKEVSVEEDDGRETKIASIQQQLVLAVSNEVVETVRRNASPNPLNASSDYVAPQRSFLHSQGVQSLEGPSGSVLCQFDTDIKETKHQAQPKTQMAGILKSGLYASIPSLKNPSRPVVTPKPPILKDKPKLPLKMDKGPPHIYKSTSTSDLTLPKSLLVPNQEYSLRQSSRSTEILSDIPAEPMPLQSFKRNSEDASSKEMVGANLYDMPRPVGPTSKDATHSVQVGSETVERFDTGFRGEQHRLTDYITINQQAKQIAVPLSNSCEQMGSPRSQPRHLFEANRSMLSSKLPFVARRLNGPEVAPDAEVTDRMQEVPSDSPGEDAGDFSRPSVVEEDSSSSFSDDFDDDEDEESHGDDVMKKEGLPVKSSFFRSSFAGLYFKSTNDCLVGLGGVLEPPTVRSHSVPPSGEHLISPRKSSANSSSAAFVTAKLGLVTASLFRSSSPTARSRCRDRKASGSRFSLKKLLHFGSKDEEKKLNRDLQRQAEREAKKSRLQIVHPIDYNQNGVEVITRPQKTSAYEYIGTPALLSSQQNPEASSDKSKLSYEGCRISPVLGKDSHRTSSASESSKHGLANNFKSLFIERRSSSSSSNISRTTSSPVTLLGFNSEGRPKPPPPPRLDSSVESKDKTSRPLRPPPPRTNSLAGSKGFDSVYANLGDVRAQITPRKPGRSASIRDEDKEKRRAPLPPSQCNSKHVRKASNDSTHRHPKGPAPMVPQSSVVQNESASPSSQPGSVELLSSHYAVSPITVGGCFVPSTCSSAQGEYSKTVAGNPTEKNPLRNQRVSQMTLQCLEEQYGAVVTSNHEALSNILDQAVLFVHPVILNDCRSLTGHWSEFSIDAMQRPVVVGHRIFYAAQANHCNVTLLVTPETKVDSHHLLMPRPVAEFRMEIPVSYLTLVEAPPTITQPGSVFVLPKMNMVTLGEYAKDLHSHKSHTPDVWEKEVFLVLLQFVTGLKHLQALGLEEFSLDLLVVAHDDGLHNPRVILVPPPSSETTSNLVSLCECALAASLIFLNTCQSRGYASPNKQTALGILSKLTAIFQEERAGSLTKAKCLLEICLYGPQNCSSIAQDLPANLQKWLDLERAKVLHQLILQPHSHQLQETKFHLLFLVRSNIRCLTEAVLMLEAANCRSS